MEQRVLKTLEYEKIVALLMEKATSIYGREKAEALLPFLRIEEVRSAQQATSEAVTALRLKGSVPLGGIRDIRAPIQRARLNAMLAPMELLDIAGTIGAGRRLRHFLLDLCENEPLPMLQFQAERIEGLREMETEIRRCIDDDGAVVDSASPELRQVRQEIRQLEARVREKLDQMTRSSSYQKMLMENIVTIRGDRFVIPVKQEYRHVFGGIVHDQSASGATLFIEPEAVVTMNNKLRELRLREEREVERILYTLTELVAQSVEELKENIDALAELDFMFAKAQLAGAMKAVCPKLNDRGYLRLKKARHPLIPHNAVVPAGCGAGRSLQRNCSDWSQYRRENGIAKDSRTFVDHGDGRIAYSCGGRERGYRILVCFRRHRRRTVNRAEPLDFLQSHEEYYSHSRFDG